MTLWYYNKPIIVDVMSFPFYVKPIKLLTNVTNLKILRNLPENVTEGVKFSNSTPIIQVLDKNGSPLSEKLVIALVCHFNGKDYPYRYVNTKKGYKSKKLLNPFPGIYNNDSGNPLSNVDPVIPIFTDENGTVSFNDSYFSQYGPSGIYKLEFICDGINIVTAEINVCLSVTSILKKK